LVAKSYRQQEDIDNNDVFSYVVKYTSTLILLALVAQYELEFDRFDMKTAFFHNNLDEENFMTQATGSRL